MKNENQVTCLELSTKLRETGCPQDSQFYWFVTDNTDAMLMMKINDNLFINVKDNREEFPSIKDLEEDIWKCYSAYTVAELGEKLPVVIQPDKNKLHYSLRQWKVDKTEYHLWYYRGTDKDNFLPCNAPTEANARAKMYLHLKRKGLL